MKSGWKKYLLYSILIIVGGSLLFGLIRLGYSAEWTGFGEYTQTSLNAERGKTLWDWMELLIIPLVLAGGAFFLNQSERAVEREIVEKRAELERENAKDHQREQALQAYLDRMSELLINDSLQTTRKKSVRNVARTRTLSVLRDLDGRRKGEVIKFLHEAGLINNDKPIIELFKADLRGADLSYTNLRGASLYGANLEGANLEEINIVIVTPEFSGKATLLVDERGVRYEEPDEINFQGTNMQKTILRNANLIGADLLESNLEYADLSGADLRQSAIRWAAFEKSNIKLKDAIMPDGTIHE